MTFKDLTAIAQLLTGAAAIWWLGQDAANGGLVGATAASTAQKLLWVIGAVILANIVVTIIGAILVSIAQREELKDEKDDERDRLIQAKSQRDGYFAASVLGALALIPLAMGVDPLLAVYGLFAAPMAGGLVSAVSQLVYYRIG
jgi:hypothetical protein